MPVRFTSEVEQERIKNKPQPKKWELFRSSSIAAAVRFARDNGWAEKKVQVRVEITRDNVVEYSVEPYEECNCPALLKYEDYYGEEN